MASGVASNSTIMYCCRAPVSPSGARNAGTWGWRAATPATIVAFSLGSRACMRSHKHKVSPWKSAGDTPAQGNRAWRCVSHPCMRAHRSTACWLQLRSCMHAAVALAGCRGVLFLVLEIGGALLHLAQNPCKQTREGVRTYDAVPRSVCEHCIPRRIPDIHNHSRFGGALPRRCTHTPSQCLHLDGRKKGGRRCDHAGTAHGNNKHSHL